MYALYLLMIFKNTLQIRVKGDLLKRTGLMRKKNLPCCKMICTVFLPLALVALAWLLAFWLLLRFSSEADILQQHWKFHILCLPIYLIFEVKIIVLHVFKNDNSSSYSVLLFRISQWLISNFKFEVSHVYGRKSHEFSYSELLKLSLVQLFLNLIIEISF